jgi:hypothetical protein
MNDDTDVVAIAPPPSFKRPFRLDEWVEVAAVLDYIGIRHWFDVAVDGDVVRVSAPHSAGGRKLLTLLQSRAEAQRQEACINDGTLHLVLNYSRAVRIEGGSLQVQSPICAFLCFTLSGAAAAYVRANGKEYGYGWVLPTSLTTSLTTSEAFTALLTPEDRVDLRCALDECRAGKWARDLEDLFSRELPRSV